MKALLINEILDFNMEGSPLSKMGIGKSRIDMNFIKEHNWILSEEYIFSEYDIIELIKNFEGTPILLLKDKNREIYRAISELVFSNFYNNSNDALKNIKEEIRKINY